MGVPAAAVEQYRLSQRLQARAQLRARRAWAQVQVGLLSQSWEVILRNSGLVAELSALQVEAATAGASYGAATLAAQGLYEAPVAFVDPSGFAGIAADGRSLAGSLYAAVPYTKNLIGGGMAPAVAKVKGGAFLELKAKTEIADAGRAAAGVDTFTRPGVGYVRMLNPPSCSRCSILAGKYYRSNEGFRRHPGCDCIHVQTSVEGARSEGLMHDPYEYFESLSEGEQDKLYTRAGAQAIRDGSDIFQVVNSRRGMKPGGLVTTEGVTKRGNYGSSTGAFEKTPDSKYMRSTRARLTPEGIYSQGLPREQTLRLLERNGYVLPGGQNPHGAIRGAGYGFSSTATMTAAQKRVQNARLNWEAAQAGRNPFGKGPLTPADAARAEGAFRKTLATNGEIFTR